MEHLLRAVWVWFALIAALGCAGRISPAEDGPESVMCNEASGCVADQDSADPDDPPGDSDPPANMEPEQTPEGPNPGGGMGNGACQNPVARPTASQGSGFFVSAGKIYDPNGCPFLPLGFNGAVYWNVTIDGNRGAHSQEHTASVMHMSQAGANTVRLVTQTEGEFGWNANPETQRELVELAVAQRLVPILEMHNATCGERPIEPVRTYWESAPMVRLAQDFEESMWINIANEADFPSPEAWRDFYSKTIASLRGRGVGNLIVVDAGAHCGQDPEAILKYGKDVLEADPHHNVLFSFHMYGYWKTELCPRCSNWTPPFQVDHEFQALIDTGLAIYIGEFGWDTTMSQEIVYDPREVVQIAEELGIGWTFWAWYEENPDYRVVQGLDQPGALTEAGEFLVPYLHSIAAPATHME